MKKILLALFLTATFKVNGQWNDAMWDDYSGFHLVWYGKGSYLDYLWQEMHWYSGGKYASPGFPFLEKAFGLLRPFPASRLFVDNQLVPMSGHGIDKRTGGCYCPRVFEPVCGDNDVTYASSCVLACAKLNVTIRREGPCIFYRRQIYAFNVSLPEKWAYQNRRAESLIHEDESMFDLTWIGFPRKNSSKPEYNKNKPFNMSEWCQEYKKINPNYNETYINVMIKPEPSHYDNYVQTFNNLAH